MCTSVEFLGPTTPPVIKPRPMAHSVLKPDWRPDYCYYRFILYSPFTDDGVEDLWFDEKAAGPDELSLFGFLLSDSSDIDVANALVQLKRSVVSRRPLHCRNGWDGGHSRSPSPPDFGLEREKRTLRRKL